MGLADKDFDDAIINTFKELKEATFKEFEKVDMSH